ncbi:MAG: TRAP transporter small permease [Firmicutes bacterium]|jgi:TRAP-type C4-dicarboxylate transport system permease small subunit|nr:TRAP transporter small permease [Bacillota bacterium]
MLLIKRVIYSASGYLLKIALVLTMLMMFATVADVLLRAVINRPIPGVYELTRYALAVIVFTSLGWSQMHKVHIAIDLIMTRLSAFWQNIIDVVNYILAVITFSLSFWQMIIYTGRLYSTNLVTTVLRAHVYPWVLVSAIGMLFFTLVLLVDLLNVVNKLVKGVEIGEPASHWNS